MEYIFVLSDIIWINYHDLGLYIYEVVFSLYIQGSFHSRCFLDEYCTVPSWNS